MELVDRRYEDGVLVELYRRGEAYEVRRDGEVALASDGPRVEKQIAELALAPWQGRDDITVLVTSVGMGHIVRALLDVPGVVKVDALEPSQALRDWDRPHFASTNGDALGDKRVTLHASDVTAFLSQARADAPGWFVMLYDAWHAPLPDDNLLDRVESSLRGGGVLALWHTRRDDELLKRLSSRFSGVVKLAVPVGADLGHVYRGRRGAVPVAGKLLN